MARPIRVNSLDEVTRIANGNIEPGQLVKTGIVVAGAGDTPLGIALDDPAKTSFVDGDPVSVGVKGRYNARLAAGESVTEGDLLVPAANGELQKASTLSVASGVTTVTSVAANGPNVITGDYGDNQFICRAMETVDNSGGTSYAEIEVLI